MEVQLRELGWKIKSRGLLKGKVTFFRDVFHVKNPSLVDLLLLTENMGKDRIHILSRGCKISAWHQFKSSLILFLLSFAADARNRLSCVFLSTKNSASSVWEFPF